MSAAQGVTSVIVGPDQHGVVRHALAVATATRSRVGRHLDVGSLSVGSWAPASVHHWHFTDRLFGASADEAARAFVTAVGHVEARHAVTLHDIPEADATAHSRRRRAAYRAVTGAVDEVIVASEHECRRLRRGGIVGAAHVIPLPIEPLDPLSADVPLPPCRRRTVGVLGFVYPGKGHDAVVAASAGLADDVEIVVVGRASDGHADLVDALHRSAADIGRSLTVTGFLDDATLATVLERIDVPVVPAPTTSASASLSTWIGAGRRPLVAGNPYASELAAHDDELVTFYEPDGLVAAIAGALADPASTRRRRPIPATLTIGAVAAGHETVYRLLVER